MMRLPADTVPVLLLAVLEALAILLRLAVCHLMLAPPVEAEGAALRLGDAVCSLLNWLGLEDITTREPVGGVVLALELERVGARADGTHFGRR